MASSRRRASAGGAAKYRFAFAELLSDRFVVTHALVTLCFCTRTLDRIYSRPLPVPTPSWARLS